MSDWIRKLEYGNRDIGLPVDITTYWLDGPLKTSIEEQIVFLTALAQESLPLNERTFELGKSIMKEAEEENWSLYAKSGFSGSVGWYVGWVDSCISGVKETYVFAFNMDIQSWDELPKRKEVVWKVLSSIGALAKKPL